MVEQDRITPPAVLSTSLSLIARLRAQEGDAWGDFLALYGPLVVRWCHRQYLSEPDIADVAQEVFRKVAQSIQRYRKEAASDSFRGWLCRITHHEIVNFFHQRDPLAQAQGGSDLLARLRQVPERPLAEPDADEARQEVRYLYHQAVERARSEFSDKTWRMFWRATVDGNPAPAVAEEFATTPAAVRQAKSRVLRRLKQVVGDVD